MSENALSINVAGTKYFDPSAMIDKLSAGVHPVEITAFVAREPSKNGGADNSVVSFKVVDGADKGKSGKIWLGTDVSDKDGIAAKKWKTFLASVVKDPAILEKGNVNVTEKFLVGKKSLVYCQPAPDGAKRADGKKEYDNLTFVTAELAKGLRAAHSPPSGATATGKQDFQVEGGAPGASGGAPRPDAAVGGAEANELV
jgi:hypothetical protein